MERRAWKRLHRADLEADAVLRAAYEIACGRRWVARCEDGWLRFVAAAEHALRVSTSPDGPGGLFTAIVSRGLWLHVAVIDEERARRRLARECWT